MISLSEKIEAEKDNIEKTLKNLEKARDRKEKSVIELSAVAAFYIIFIMELRIF